ncbi:MAG: shikimate dehydrogenase, partial [Bacteroidota bacterium]
LGTGGASKAVRYALHQLGISYLFVSRTANSNQHYYYEQLSKNLIQQYKLIINTTPLGMLPNVGAFPDIPYQALTKDHLLYDLVYNPETSLFLQKGLEMGAKVKNGIEMLHIQADKAFEIWRREGV